MQLTERIIKTYSQYGTDLDLLCTDSNGRVHYVLNEATHLVYNQDGSLYMSKAMDYDAANISVRIKGVSDDSGYIYVLGRDIASNYTSVSKLRGSDLAVIWEKTVGDKYNSVVNIGITNDNQFLIIQTNNREMSSYYTSNGNHRTGLGLGSFDDYILSFCNSANSSDNSTYVWVYESDTDINKIWKLDMTGSSWSREYSRVVNPNNQSINADDIDMVVDTEENVYLGFAQNNYSYLQKFSLSNGNKAWERTVPYPNENYGSRTQIEIDSKNNIYLNAFRNNFRIFDKEGNSWTIPNSFPNDKAYNFTLDRGHLVIYWWGNDKKISYYKIPLFPEMWVNINGTNRKCEEGWVKVNGAWREIEEIYCKINGTWRKSE